WQLPRKTNCSGELVRPGPEWFQRKSILWPDFLAEPPGAERARDRLRKGARPQMAARPLDRHLYLPGGAAGHGRRTRLELRTPVYHSLAERDHRPARLEREVLGWSVLAARPWTLGGSASPKTMLIVL